jgi:hypothetical protein
VIDERGILFPARRNCMLMYSYSQEDSLCSVVLQKRGILHNAVSVVRGILLLHSNNSPQCAAFLFSVTEAHCVLCYSLLRTVCRVQHLQHYAVSRFVAGHVITPKCGPSNLRNRNYLLRFRFRLLTSYGFLVPLRQKVTVPPVPVPQH